MRGTVAIDPRYWEMVRSEYNDWPSAIPRELAQNSIDAGATQITVQTGVADDSSGTWVIWSDNGCGMSRNTILNKLLCLGGSGKEFEGTIGGFGVAKSLLLFSQQEYSVATRKWLLAGKGDRYTLSGCAPGEEVEGCRFRIKLAEGMNVQMFRKHLLTWWKLSDLGGRVSLTLDSVTVAAEPMAKKSLCQRPWADIFQIPAGSPYDGYAIIRLRGQYMHQSYMGSRIPGAICDLHSHEVLQTNRDGLKYPYSSYVEQFISAYSADPDAPQSITEPDIQLFGVDGSDQVRESGGNFAVDPGLLSDDELLRELGGKRVRKFDKRYPFPHAVLAYFRGEMPAVVTEPPAEVERTLFAWARVLEWLSDGEIVPGLCWAEPGTVAVTMQFRGIPIIAFNPISEVVLTGLKRDWIKMICIVCHELGHLKHPNHYTQWGGEFTRSLMEVLPKQEEFAREWESSAKSWADWSGVD